MGEWEGRGRVGRVGGEGESWREGGEWEGRGRVGGEGESGRGEWEGRRRVGRVEGKDRREGVSEMG